jgi:hypothetical protein
MTTGLARVEGERAVYTWASGNLLRRGRGRGVAVAGPADLSVPAPDGPMFDDQ